jgi:cytochrome c556
MSQPITFFERKDITTTSKFAFTGHAEKKCVASLTTAALFLPRPHPQPPIFRRRHHRSSLALNLLKTRLKDDGIMAEQHPRGGLSVEFKPMSPDELERMMQFIVRQQAQFAANMDRVEADLAKVEANLGSVAEQQAGLESRQEAFEAHQQRFEAHQERFEANMERLSAKTDNIADGLIGLTGVVGRLTDVVWRLQDTFDRHLREQHGLPPS